MKPNKIEECGCCEVGIPPTPEKINNRPGLPELSCRVGTYASFRQAMIEAIAQSPELRDWTARQSGDYGIALIEMWAYLADILTFYQERIANEAFLRTALHRDTVMRLAAMLDYKLNPGVAATAYLSFLVEKEKKVKIPPGLRVQSVPGQDEKPQNFETVETVLAEDKLNQVRIFPKPQFYNPFAQDSLGGIVISDSDKISPGDTIVVFDATRAEFKEVSDLSVRDDQHILGWFPEIGGSKFQQFSTRVFPCGQKFQLFGYNAPEFYMEPSTASDGAIQWTLKKSPGDYDFSLPIPTPSTFSLDAVYDNLKPNSKLLLVGISGDEIFTRMATIKEVTTTPDQFPDQSGPLQGSVTQVSLDMQLTVTPVVVLDPPDRLHVFTIGDDGSLWTINHNEGWGGWTSLGGQIDMVVVGKNEDGRLEVFAQGMDKALWHIWQLAPEGAWSQWSSLGGQIDMLAVGNNEGGRLEVFARGMDKALWHIWQLAPEGAWSQWSSLGGQIDMLAVGNNEGGRLEVFARGMDKALWHIWQLAPEGGWSQWASLGSQIDLLAVGKNEYGRLIVFARGMDKALRYIGQLAPEGGWSQWASLSGQIDMLAVGECKDCRLQVFARGMDKALWYLDSWRYGWYSLGVPMWTIQDIRKILIYELTGSSIEFWNRYYPASFSGNTIYTELDKVKEPEKDRVFIIDDKDSKPELITVSMAKPIDTDSDGKEDHLAITFTPALTRPFDSSSAQIFGNIAKATHGETVSGEILGNGDFSQKFQQFILKKSPTTYVLSTKTATGTQNTLEVRIGGVLWKETESLFGLNADDEMYITRINDDGEMSVQFGDGETGARLPSGRDNVVAKYRQGLGGDGNVAVNSITTLLDRPVGLKKVTNPAQAEGGTDPESLDEARENAPNTVRIFDRVISLRDYEDFARSYTGIAKARAVKKFENEQEMIQLTIAGENGEVIAEHSSRYDSFTRSLDQHRDINQMVRVIPHENRPLAITAQIKVDTPRYVEETVRAGVREAVLRFFGFENMQLGQAVHLSDIYAVIQAVEGVVGTLIVHLYYRETSSPTLGEHLPIEPNRIAVLDTVDLVISPAYSVT